MRPIAEIDELAICPHCGAFANPASRQIVRTHFYGAKVEDATWDPAFGKVIKSSRHRKDEAKARGWTEVGNEKPETVEKHFAQQREDTKAQRWAEADREKLYE